MSLVSCKLIIKGRVQGVGYRYYTLQQARNLGLGGWIRNKADSSVEIEVSGDTALVELFIGSCKEGPTRARVDELLRQTTPYTEYPGFKIR